MGRLDDAAKLKVVELRKAGLSFRKIKAVLELENIKVSAQAIYLFLKEFQARPPGAARPGPEAGGGGGVGGGGNSASPPVRPGPPRPAGLPQPWTKQAQLQHLLREASQQANCGTELAFGSKNAAASSEARPSSSGSGDAGGGTRGEGNRDDGDIQIVSVTSLAQSCRQRPTQSTAAAAAAARTLSGTPTNVATSLAMLRRRITPSPAANPVLAARKRLLDRALLHRSKSFQPLGLPQIRRPLPTSTTADDVRSAMAREHEKYNLTDDNSAVTGPPAGANHDPRRLVTHRPPMLVLGRSPQAPPRVGVRPPDHRAAVVAAAAPPLTSSAGRTPLVRVQAPIGQGAGRRDASASPQQQKEGAGGGVGGCGGCGGGGSGLQEQVQLLATEVRGLGLALKILVDQQSRLEREQVQQTRVQKQILGALQGLASRLGPCVRGQQQQQHDKTPPPPLPHPPPPPVALPTAAAATSFGENAFAYGHGAYNTPCGQAPAAYNPLDGLVMAEATFKLPEQRNASVNGFPPCGDAESSLSQPYAQAHAYPTHAYAQTSPQPFAQWIAQPFRGLEGKAPAHFPGRCLEGSLQDCGVPRELSANADRSSRDDRRDIVKVEIL